VRYCYPCHPCRPPIQAALQQTTIHLTPTTTHYLHDAHQGLCASNAHGMLCGASFVLIHLVPCLHNLHGNPPLGSPIKNVQAYNRVYGTKGSTLNMGLHPAAVPAGAIASGQPVARPAGGNARLKPHSTTAAAGPATCWTYALQACTLMSMVGWVTCAHLTIDLNTQACKAHASMSVDLKGA
jgi:hypothetical protein